MIDHIRAFDNNMFVPLYFIFIIIIGDFLLLNLFLAILINNFGETAEKIEHKTKKRKSYFSVKGFINSLTRQNKVTPYENVKKEYKNFILFKF